MPLDNLMKYPVSFFLPLVAVALTVPFLKKLLLWSGMVDVPGSRRLHTAAVPRGGGIAVFLTVFFGVMLLEGSSWYEASKHNFEKDWFTAFFYGSAFLFIVGLLDDLVSIGGVVKLLGQSVSAIIFFGISGGLSTIQGVPLPWSLDLILTIVWFVAFINAFNLIDGLDGLASGLAAIAALGLAGSAYFRELPGDALILLIFAGACIGFLRHNFHPASIFLGDCGSMFLGFFLAAIAVGSTTKGSTIASLGVPLLAIGIPIFDTLLAVWRRSVRSLGKRAGQRSRRTGVMTADMDHIHHRLVKAGLNQKRVALVLYGLNVALVILGVSTLVFNSYASGIFLIAFVLGCYVVFRHLARVELWDSGNALIRGLRKPSRSLVASLLYPIFDVLSLVFATFVSTALTSTLYQTLEELKVRTVEATPIWAGISFISLVILGTYNRVWSRARTTEFAALSIILFAGALCATAIWSMIEPTSLKVLCTRGMLFLGTAEVLIVGLRAFPRAVQDLMGTFDKESVYNRPSSMNILVYGAGYRGLLYLKQKVFSSDKAEDQGRIHGFIDDDPNLRKRFVHGYKVLGNGSEIPSLVERLGITHIIVTADLPKDKMLRLIQYAKLKNISLSRWAAKEELLQGPNLMPAESVEEKLKKALVR